MKCPLLYNVPQGKGEYDALPDELLQLLRDVFQAVTHAFGENATLYRLDIGRVHESVQSGELVIAGQFVDRSDGELFEFEIDHATNKVQYKSTGDFLDKQALTLFLDEATGDSDAGGIPESSSSSLNPFDILLLAINEESSEVYQSQFAVKLRNDLDYLGALSAAMYHAGVTIEAQPLYTGLHIYAIKYALNGLKLFSQTIATIESEAAGEMAAAWVEEHGLDCAAAVIKEFSSRRCVRFQEMISPGDQEANQELSELVKEAIGMAMAATTELIKSVVEAVEYQPGDVQATLAASIEEYCPIDNSDGYVSVPNALRLAADWQEVVNRSGCKEDLSIHVLGLPSADTIAAESSTSQDHQREQLAENGPGNEEQPDGERIFYVNVGEGPSRNWDDCRRFGFLAAGSGRKWSKQLEKLRIGDTVIAYLKGHGYVGIGTITSTATPATKFTVNGVSIKELPLINDTIRSIKRFNKENGEYLIGVEWEVAVAREQAAWKSNANLFTTALVCASLRNQPNTVSFVNEKLAMSAPAHSAPNPQPSEDVKVNNDWECFSRALAAFLQSNIDDIDSDELRIEAASLHALCPNDLLAIEQARSIQTIMAKDLNDKLTKVCTRLIEEGDEMLAMFFIGICELGDMTDEILEQFLDLVDEGMNLNTLATSFVPCNAFEANTLVSLLHWSELPDWARAHLVTRNEIGLTQDDRDGVIEYLGFPDNLGSDTLLSVSHDIIQEPCKYSIASIEALKAFVRSDFELVSEFNGSNLDELENHFNELGSYCISESKKILGIL